MSETLRELFGTPEESKPVPVPVPVPVATPVVVEVPQVSLRAQRTAILNNRDMKVRDKIKAIRELCRPIR
jgi:hypothetical protein